MKKLNYSAISLQDVRIFIEIGTSLNVSRAADRMKVSQPTASYSLEKMRRAFDDKLVVRVGRALELTSMGHKLFAYWKPVLDNLDSMLADQDFDPATSTETFGIIGTAFEMTSSRGSFIEFLTQQAPRVGFQSIGPFQENVDEYLHRDFHLYIGPVQKPAAGVCSLPLGNFETLLYHNADIVDAPDTLEKFMDMDFAYLRRTTGHGGVINEVLWDQWRLRRKEKNAFSDYVLIAQFVANTPAVATMSSLMSWCHMRPLDVARLPFDVPSIPYELRWSETKDHDNRLVWLREQLLDYLANIPRTLEEVLEDRTKSAPQGIFAKSIF